MEHCLETDKGTVVCMEWDTAFKKLLQQELRQYSGQAPVPMLCRDGVLDALQI